MRPLKVETGAPYRFNRWMSRKQFNRILSSLGYTNEKKPTFCDSFLGDKADDNIVQPKHERDI